MRRAASLTPSGVQALLASRSTGNVGRRRSTAWVLLEQKESERTPPRLWHWQGPRSRASCSVTRTFPRAVIPPNPRARPASRRWRRRKSRASERWVPGNHLQRRCLRLPESYRAPSTIRSIRALGGASPTRARVQHEQTPTRRGVPRYLVAARRNGTGSDHEDSTRSDDDDCETALSELQALRDTVLRVRAEVTTQRRECVNLGRVVSGLRAQLRQLEEGGDAPQE